MILSGIYRIKNIITNDCYVGSSVNIERRWKQHHRRLKKNTHDNQYMQNAYNKYGTDAFKYEILEICPAELILEREQERLNSKSYAYNICTVAGSTAGRVLSAEHKARISAANKGKTSHRSGQKISAEHKAKIGAANKGKGSPHSAETRAKISAAAKRRYAKGDE